MVDAGVLARRAHVEVTSPDRSVRALFTATDGTVLWSDRYPAMAHTDPSLEDQIQYVLDGIISGFTKTRQHIRDRMSESFGPTDGTDPATRIARERYRRLEEYLHDVAVVAKSPSGWVKIRLSTAAGFQVKLRSGAVERCGVQTVIEDVNAAIAIAAREYGTYTAAAHQAIFVDLTNTAIEEEL